MLLDKCEHHPSSSGTRMCDSHEIYKRGFWKGANNKLHCAWCVQVRENVKTAIEVEQSASIDEELLQQVEQILQPVKNMTWPSGREENN